MIKGKGLGDKAIRARRPFALVFLKCRFRACFNKFPLMRLVNSVRFTERIIVSWSSLIQDVVSLQNRAGKLGVGRAELPRYKRIPPIKGEESLSVMVYNASSKRGGART